MKSYYYPNCDYRTKEFYIDFVRFIYNRGWTSVEITGPNYPGYLQDTLHNALKVRTVIIAQIASNSKSRINKFIQESIEHNHTLNLMALSKSENISKKKREFIESVLIMNKLLEK